MRRLGIALAMAGLVVASGGQLMEYDRGKAEREAKESARLTKLGWTKFGDQIWLKQTDCFSARGLDGNSLIWSMTIDVYNWNPTKVFYCDELPEVILKFTTRERAFLAPLVWDERRKTYRAAKDSDAIGRQQTSSVLYVSDVAVSKDARPRTLVIGDRSVPVE